MSPSRAFLLGLGIGAGVCTALGWVLRGHVQTTYALRVALYRPPLAIAPRILTKTVDTPG